VGSEPHMFYASHATRGIRKKKKARSKHDLASWANPPTINNQPLLIIFWPSEVAALPSSAHKPRVPKRWPLRPQSWSLSKISIYIASFRSRLLRFCLDRELPGGNAFLNYFW